MSEWNELRRIENDEVFKMRKIEIPGKCMYITSFDIISQEKTRLRNNFLTCT